MAGCEQIIAVDKLESRSELSLPSLRHLLVLTISVELAKSLGATHSCNTTGIENLVAEFSKFRPSVVIDSEYRRSLT